MLCEKEGVKTRVYPLSFFSGTYCEDEAQTRIHKHNGMPITVADVRSELGPGV